MTIEEAKRKLISWANAQVGYVEGANNWNKYSAEMNAVNAYGWNVQNQPYCDIFADWCYYKVFGLDIAAKLTYQPKGGFSALCSASANFYKNNGALVSTPSVGDQVFFYADGGINHTGIVVQVGMGAISTVEGNSSDMVARRTYSVNSPAIAGYGRPNWAAVVSESSPSEPPADDKPKVTGLPTLQRGDKGEVVRAAQFLLNGRKCSCGIWGADGDFGNATEAAVLAFQRRNELDADGIIGSQTWAYLLGVN